MTPTGTVLLSVNEYRGGCATLTLPPHQTGYFMLWDKDSKSNTHAHRLLYEMFVGKVPDGFVLHHTCLHKWCINSWHLVPLSRGAHQKEHARLRRLAHPECQVCGGNDWRTLTNGTGRRCRDCHRNTERERNREMKRKRTRS